MHADTLSAVARSLALDAVSKEIVRTLAAGGTKTIVLKGPAITRWLYKDGAPRPYTDIDLLVAPEKVEAAESALARLGFTHPPLDDLPHDRPWHAHAWVRETDNAGVDLHRTLIGLGATPADAWQVLSGQTEVITVCGVPVEALNTPARALHVALHAAEDGVHGEKALEDLRRALEHVSEPDWESAADLAARLHAIPAFAAGLRLRPTGAALATRLDLPDNVPVDTAVRLWATESARERALGLEWLARIPSLRGKLGLIRQKALPPSVFMCAWSPLARRGRAGLVAAYLWRILWLVWQFPPALLAWRRARRASRSSQRAHP